MSLPVYETDQWWERYHQYSDSDKLQLGRVLFSNLALEHHVLTYYKVAYPQGRAGNHRERVMAMFETPDDPAHQFSGGIDEISKIRNRLAHELLVPLHEKLRLPPWFYGILKRHWEPAVELDTVAAIELFSRQVCLNLETYMIRLNGDPNREGVAGAYWKAELQRHAERELKEAEEEVEEWTEKLAMISEDLEEAKRKLREAKLRLQLARG